MTLPNPLVIAAAVTVNTSLASVCGTDVGELVLTITGTNDGPVAVDDTGSTTQGNAVSYDVTANDTDTWHRCRYRWPPRRHLARCLVWSILYHQLQLVRHWFR